MSRILRNAPVSEPDPRRSGAGGPPRRRSGRGRVRRWVSVGAVLAIPASFILPVTLAPTADAAVAEVGQGFTVSPSDLAFILKQIKIAEKPRRRHHAGDRRPAGPCRHRPTSSPARWSPSACAPSTGRATTWSPARRRSGAADEVFPRLAAARSSSRPRTRRPPSEAPGSTSRTPQKTGNVFDTQPRTVSNLIVDQTSTNPAAIAAAGFPVRTQGNPGVVPCTTDPDPLADPPIAAVPTDCIPVASRRSSSPT